MSEKAIIVAGGAGYIGSHFCQLASARGFSPIVVDRIQPCSARVAAYRMSSAHRFPLEVCDIDDADRIATLLGHHRPVAAVCFAALIDVAQSVAEPALYWEHNYLRPMRFFNALVSGGVRHLVFSSTAAVYGNPSGIEALAESDALAPSSPYGLSKLACELALQGETANHRVSPGVRFDGAAFDSMRSAGGSGLQAALPSLRSLVFRYFNAAGAAPNSGLGEVHEPETHLIPNAIAAARASLLAHCPTPFTIFGDDYPTHDGTCVRDYVHVLDLAEAHVAGLDYLLQGGSSDVVNLGSGCGFSVREVLAAVERATGVAIPARIGPRRPGDPARLVADVRKARRLLAWEPRRDLADIIASAVAFHDNGQFASEPT